MFSVTGWKKGEMVFTAGVLVFILGISFYQVKLGEMKTRDAQRKTDVEMVSRGLDRYFTDHGYYPPEATGSGKIAGCGFEGREPCEWGGGRVTDEYGITYINKLPDDPLAAQGYRYIYQTDETGGRMRIYVSLENLTDKDYNGSLEEWCGEGIRCRWYTE